MRTGTDHNASRRLPVVGFIGLVVVYLAIIQALPKFTEVVGTEYALPRSIEQIFRSLTVVAVAGAVIALLAVAYLRWWRPVLFEQNRTPRWTWIFPALMLLAVAAGTSYSTLAEKGLTFSLALLVSALLVGVSEETMFRGVGVVTFRNAGFSEGWVAGWTSVIFGLAHATNIFSEGVGAFPQVLTTTVAGYFFYVTRRVTGSLVPAMLIHGLWDFGLISTRVGDDLALSVGLFILADMVLAVIALATIRKVFPKSSTLNPDETG